MADAYLGMTAFANFVKHLRILTLTQAAIQRYRQLTKLKTKVGKKDLRIAAIALEASATLVTRNLRDFKRVSGLSLEDWSK